MANVQEYEVCKICVGLISDIAVNMGPTIQPHCNDFMTSKS